jgi:hypothetical protein
MGEWLDNVGEWLDNAKHNIGVISRVFKKKSATVKWHENIVKSKDAMVIDHALSSIILAASFFDNTAKMAKMNKSLRRCIKNEAVLLELVMYFIYESLKFIDKDTLLYMLGTLRDINGVTNGIFEIFSDRYSVYHACEEDDNPAEALSTSLYLLISSASKTEQLYEFSKAMKEADFNVLGMVIVSMYMSHQVPAVFEMWKNIRRLPAE